MSPVWWIAVLIVGIFAWASRDQIGNLVFAHGGSSTRPGGEWVGRMEITGDYDVATHRVKADEQQHSSAAVYMNLQVTDSFMDEYGGPGEVVVAGDPTRRPLHVGAFRLEKDGRIHGAFDVEGLTNGAQGTFTGDTFKLKSYSASLVNFTLEMHRGTHRDFEQLAATLK